MKRKSIVKINKQLCQSEDTAFGTKMRQELLRGLMFGTAALTILVLIVLTAVVLLTDLPVTIIVLIYLALIIVSWQHRCLGETQDPQMSIILMQPADFKVRMQRVGRSYSQIFSPHFW